MARDLHADTIAESDNAHVEPRFFVYLDVDGDPLWAWSGQRDVTVTVAADPLLSAGQAFMGAAEIGQISDIAQGADGSVSEITLSLLYADFTDEAASDFVNDPTQWSMRPAVVWFGFVHTTTNTIIPNPVRMLTGFMIHVAAADGTSPGIVVKLASKGALDGQRIPGWKCCDVHQQTFYSGDKALEFVSQLSGADLRFGVADNVPRASGGSGRAMADRQFEQLK